MYGVCAIMTCNIKVVVPVILLIIKGMNLLRLLFIGVLGLVVLNACEQQKQASAEVGAMPKQIIDKATSDIDHATATSVQRLEAIEHLEASEGAEN